MLICVCMQADQQLTLLEAKKKSMEILEKIRAKHRKIQEIGGPIVNSGPRLVDIRVCDRVVAVLVQHAWACIASKYPCITVTTAITDV